MKRKTTFSYIFVEAPSENVVAKATREFLSFYFLFQNITYTFLGKFQEKIFYRFGVILQKPQGGVCHLPPFRSYAPKTSRGVFVTSLPPFRSYAPKTSRGCLSPPSLFRSYAPKTSRGCLSPPPPVSELCSKNLKGCLSPPPSQS